MVQEQTITKWAFGYSLVFYAIKRMNDPSFTSNIFQIATYSLIIISAFYILASVNNLKLLYGPFIGLIAFNTLFLGILLAATTGLKSDTPSVIEALSRIVLALCATWKLSSDMRNMSLRIDPHRQPRSNLHNVFYGILFPPKEFIRLLKILFFVGISFYLVFSGLDMLGQANVDIGFLEQTEKLSLNLLFFGIQAPMMMASRASISKTFSEYIKNLEWADSMTASSSNINNAYRKVLRSNEISYDTINSNGKHIWITLLLMIILQAYQQQIVALDLFQVDWVSILSKWLTIIQDFFNSIF